MPDERTPAARRGGGRRCAPPPGHRCVRYAALALAVSLAIPAAAACGPALAQTPAAPADSVPKESVASDSLPPDSVRARPIHPPWAYLILPAAVAAAVVAGFAPAPAARWIGPRGPNDMAFMDDHWAVYGSVGALFHAGETWANSASLEVVRRGVHVEVHAEDFWRPRHVRYLTARGGYLWHPRRQAAGGVTLGYVHVDGDRARRGAELGLPLTVGNRIGTVRLEPTYVFAPGGTLWSYRLQVERYLPRRRHFVGASVTGKSQPFASESPDARFAASAVSLVFGTRF